MKKAKVATVQMDCEPNNTEGNMQRALGMIRNAKRRGAQLIVLPHMFANGYNSFLHPSRVAEEYDGPTVTFLKTVAQKLKIYLLGSFIEGIDGSYYDTSIVVDPKGDIIGSYRRVSLWQDETDDFARGEDLCIVDTSIGRAGLLVSRDLTIPEIARTLAFEGADILLISAAIDDHAYWAVCCRARAIENACFVIAANRIGVENNLSYCGHSMIIDPEGRVLSDSESREEYSAAELDPRIMEKERANYWQLVEIEESLGIEQGEYLSEPMRCRSKVPSNSGNEKRKSVGKGRKKK